MASTKTIKFDGTRFKLPASNIQIVSVRTAAGGKVKWKQDGRFLILKDPYTGELEVGYDMLVPVPVAAYYPLQQTPR